MGIDAASRSCQEVVTITLSGSLVGRQGVLTRVPRSLRPTRHKSFRCRLVMSSSNHQAAVRLEIACAGSLPIVKRHGQPKTHNGHHYLGSEIDKNDQPKIKCKPTQKTTKILETHWCPVWSFRPPPPPPHQLFMFPRNTDWNFEFLDRN